MPFSNEEEEEEIEEEEEVDEEVDFDHPSFKRDQIWSDYAEDLDFDPSIITIEAAYRDDSAADVGFAICTFGKQTSKTGNDAVYQPGGCSGDQCREGIFH